MRRQVSLILATVTVAVLFTLMGESCATPCTTSLPDGTNNVNAVVALLECRPADTLCCYTVDYTTPFDQRRLSNESLSGCWNSDGTPLMSSFDGLITMPAYSPCYYGSDSVAAESGQCSVALVPTSVETFSSLNFSGTLVAYTSTFNTNAAKAPVVLTVCLVTVLALLLTTFVPTL